MHKSLVEINFERNKNMKATAYTVGVLIILFLLFILVSWTIPVPPPPPVDTGIEVNLGNSDQGLGDVPPQIPGEPAAEQETNFNPPPSQAAQAETEHEVAENNDADIPIIHTSPKPEKKKEIAKVNNDTKKTTKKTVTNQTPAPPKPKAVYAGGKNTGASGNNADSYNNSRNQGIAGGNGDQGKPNGNINSDSYTGNGGTGSAGISITNGLQGRHIASAARFQDQYKYGGKVSVDITVDENGIVTSARVKPGSPFADLNAIAERRARQLKFNKGTTSQSGTITIVFQNPKG
ncbi:MAG: TonB family protein [Bacteroidetes bacterium]|nr:TonB family protein [Bacteroidota bacterium]